MSTLLRNGAYYALQFYDTTRTPVRKKISLRISRKADALKVKRLLETRLAEGLIDPWTQPLSAPYWGIDTTPRIIPSTVAEAVEAFLDSRSNCRPATGNHYRWVLGAFADVVGGSRPVQSVGPSDVLRWLDGVSSNPTTRHNYFQRLRTAEKWWIARSIVTKAPSTGIVVPRGPDKLAAKLVSEAQLAELVEVAGTSSTPYLANVAVVAFDLALRLSEVCAMKCSWYDRETRLLTVLQDTAFSTKAGRDVVKPVSTRAQRVLDGLVDGRAIGAPVFLNNRGRPLSPKHTSKRFKAIVRQTGLPESITFHGLRHGGISKALANGASVEAVRMFAGHTTVAMTMRYAHLLPHQYEEQIRNALR